MLSLASQHVTSFIFFRGLTFLIVQNPGNEQVALFTVSWMLVASGLVFSRCTSHITTRSFVRSAQIKANCLFYPSFLLMRIPPRRQKQVHQNVKPNAAWNSLRPFPRPRTNRDSTSRSESRECSKSCSIPCLLRDTMFPHVFDGVEHPGKRKQDGGKKRFFNKFEKSYNEGEEEADALSLSIRVRNSESWGLY